VTLKGHCIWTPTGPPQRYLDGQVFGQPARTAGGTSVISLNLPSGNGDRASDFESWFTPVATPALTGTLVAAVPPILRAEGLTEEISDFVLLITGGVPPAAGQPVLLVNVTVNLNANVTSRLFTAPLQDAVLLIDDPLVLNTTPPPPGPAGVGGSGLNFRSG